MFLSQDLLQCSEVVAGQCCKIKSYEESEKINFKVRVRRHKLTEKGKYRETVQMCRYYLGSIVPDKFTFLLNFCTSEESEQSEENLLSCRVLWLSVL